MPHANSTAPARLSLAECLRHVEQITDGALDAASDQVRELVALQLQQAIDRLSKPSHRPAVPLPTEVIVHVGAHYGQMHRVLARHGRTLRVKHPEGDTFEVHVCDTESEL